MGPVRLTAPPVGPRTDDVHVRSPSLGPRWARTASHLTPTAPDGLAWVRTASHLTPTASDGLAWVRRRGCRVSEGARPAHPSAEQVGGVGVGGSGGRLDAEVLPGGGCGDA